MNSGGRTGGGQQRSESGWFCKRDSGWRWVAFALLLLIQPAVRARQAEQQQQRPLKVATRLIAPFVFEEKGRLAGFSMDLWRAIEEQMGVPQSSALFVTPNVKALLSTVQERKADLGIAAISVTAERDRTLDFSHPMFDAGLHILVRDKSGGNGSVPSLIAVILSPALFQLLGLSLGIILVFAHLVWLVERRHESGIIETPAYFPGIFKAFWWAAGTLGAQADEMPRSALGRVIALIWMFGSIVFVAYFTAAVTTSLTVRQLQGNIQGPDDLPGKKVATTTGSTAAAYLREQRARVSEFKQIEQAYAALQKGQVEAVVFDAPVLLYYSAHEGQGKVEVVGPVFHKESYGIAFPPGSPYRKRVNNALLTLKENGAYDELYNKWFSSNE